MCAMNEMRNFILSLKSPVVFHGKIAEWDLLKWDEETWCNLFGDDPVPFRCGLKTCASDPQWERTCSTEHMTMKKFFEDSKEVSSNVWRYFDYKHLTQWLKDSVAFESVSWSNLGFPEITKDKCTLWIGSSNAHTPCHMDSYGCNLVAQIRGHKQWILFPPSESAKLKMTRVPYEESSVYSSLNFNAPLGNLSDSLDNVYIVTLFPGDVLFVPHHWWHYVENLDTAIAINTWLPLPEDDDCRLDEVLVRFFVSQASANLPPVHWSKIINPNEDDLSETNLSSILTQMKFCIENAVEASNAFEKSISEEPVHSSDLDHPHQDAKRRKISPLNSQGLSDCLGSSNVKEPNMTDFKLLTKSNVSELRNILDAKCKCGSKEEHTERMKSILKSDNIMDMMPAVINSFCHPDVLQTVKRLLLDQICIKKM